jgi:hypothetical protein
VYTNNSHFGSPPVSSKGTFSSSSAKSVRRSAPPLLSPPVTSHESPVTDSSVHLFARPVTCPEDVHPPYYWSKPFSPTNFLRVTVPSFSCVGGCDG